MGTVPAYSPRSDDVRAMQERGRGTARPLELDMEPCPTCGTFIKPGTECDHQLPVMLISGTGEN